VWESVLYCICTPEASPQRKRVRVAIPDAQVHNEEIQRGRAGRKPRSPHSTPNPGALSPRRAPSPLFPCPRWHCSSISLYIYYSIACEALQPRRLSFLYLFVSVQSCHIDPSLPYYRGLLFVGAPNL
jgi:hypothetical protein